MKRLNVEMLVLPGGCTRFVQPADVSWNKPFKAKVMQLYNHWMMNGEHEVTAAGNLKPPPPEVYLDWILEAWVDGVKKGNAVNSFKTCEIMTALDGSEDHLIHCLKDGNGMPKRCYKLAQEGNNNAESDCSDDSEFCVHESLV
ncbi:pogo transposable element with KRAB domain-like protein [Aphelenchoides avenae]|nr:pogo transposable element with KRAB domain-like protein [Aphelenchus avenae]